MRALSTQLKPTSSQRYHHLMVQIARCSNLVTEANGRIFRKKNVDECEVRQILREELLAQIGTDPETGNEYGQRDEKRDAAMLNRGSTQTIVEGAKASGAAWMTCNENHLSMTLRSCPHSSAKACNSAFPSP